MANLYEEYINSQNSDIESKIEVINKIAREHPKLIDYIYTKIDSCYGTHKVYLVHMKVHGEDVIKLGYTKNSVEGRFAEKRYAGRENMELINIIRQGELQAKGAVIFEKKLKELFEGFKTDVNLILPGRGEFYSIEHIDEMTEIYDNTINDHKNIIGLKPPN